MRAWMKICGLAMSCRSHDAASHGAARHDAASHDAASHGAAHRDAASRDAASHDAASHETHDRVVLPRHKPAAMASRTAATEEDIETAHRKLNAHRIK